MYSYNFMWHFLFFSPDMIEIIENTLWNNATIPIRLWPNCAVFLTHQNPYLFLLCTILFHIFFFFQTVMLFLFYFFVMFFYEFWSIAEVFEPHWNFPKGNSTFSFFGYYPNIFLHKIFKLSIILSEIAYC